MFLSPAGSDQINTIQDNNLHVSTPSIAWRSKRLFILAAIFVLFGAAAFAVDVPLAQFCRHLESEGLWPGDLVRLLNMSEAFGHGFGVFLILLSVFVLDPGHRRAIVRVAAAAYGSGLAANLIKLMVARWRPHSFEQWDAGVWDTFCGFMAFGAGGSRVQSFPSAHTATAVGLAIGLAWLYPRGRWLFAVFAVLVGCQRIQGGAHFASDVMFGAAVGCLVGAVCVYHVGWFDRFESRG